MRNRCFYQCLSRHLGVEGDLFDVCSAYMLSNRFVDISQEVRFVMVVVAVVVVVFVVVFMGAYKQLYTYNMPFSKT